LNNPQGVAVDGSGNVYIGDTLDNAVKEWNAGTQQVSTLVGSGLNYPAGVAVDSQGNVYFADEKNNAIKEWSVATGTVTPLVATGLSSPVGVALDAQGNVYFSDAGHSAIKKWSVGTQQVSTLVSTGLNIPLGVAVDAFGNVYFADEKNNAIKEWSVTTTLVSTLVSGLNLPYGVAVDGDGNVYFADTGNNAVKEWSPASQQVTVLVSSGVRSPCQIAVDGQGNIYIADLGDKAIKKYTAVYLSLGATSRNEGAVAGTDSISYQVVPASTILTAASNQSWLTITGTTGGAIGFSFTANTSVSSRSATITVLGQTITVTQSADVPTTISKIAGLGQHTPVNQPFAVGIEVRVTDAAGKGVQGVSVTFVVDPAANGAAGTFASSPPMPILTNSSGYATAPVLTANSITGTFGVTASAGTLSTLIGATITSN
jgi:sugar lactone lactonase YvrE